MPLARGYSRKIISENVRRERRRGRKAPQAVAIAYDEARRSWRSRHPHGPFPRILTRRLNPGGSMLPILAVGAGLVWWATRQQTTTNSPCLNAGESSIPTGEPCTKADGSRGMQYSVRPNCLPGCPCPQFIRLECR